MPRALIFGGGGQIGSACVAAFSHAGFETVATGRQSNDAVGIVAYDPLGSATMLPDGQRFDAVVWAQGTNLNDSIVEFDIERHRALYEANVLFVAASMNALVTSGRLAVGAKMCVVSSVWQRVARTKKFSYMTTKAALSGLVMSAALDLAEHNIMVNAVLPGALETPMTRQNLSADQIDKLARMTPFNRLPEIADVAALCLFLCSSSNTSITGQFISVDLGFEHARLV